MFGIARASKDDEVYCMITLLPYISSYFVQRDCTDKLFHSSSNIVKNAHFFNPLTNLVHIPDLHHFLIRDMLIYIHYIEFIRLVHQE